MTELTAREIRVAAEEVRVGVLLLLRLPLVIYPPP